MPGGRLPGNGTNAALRVVVVLTLTLTICILALMQVLGPIVSGQDVRGVEVLVSILLGGVLAALGLVPWKQPPMKGP